MGFYIYLYCVEELEKKKYMIVCEISMKFMIY